MANETRVEVLEMQLNSLKSQVFVLFGLLVMTLGGLTYCLFTLSSNETTDLIQASRIQIIDDEGFPLIDLGQHKYDRHSAGALFINSTKGDNDVQEGQGSMLLSLCAADKDLNLGAISSWNGSTGKPLVTITSNYESSGEVNVHNASGESVSSLVVTNGGHGALYTYDAVSMSISDVPIRRRLSGRFPE